MDVIVVKSPMVVAVVVGVVDDMSDGDCRLVGKYVNGNGSPKLTESVLLCRLLILALFKLKLTLLLFDLVV